MELDELRQRWQQAAEPDAPSDTTEAALRQLLSRRSGSPAARLERNLWLEVVCTGLFAVAGAGALLAATDAYTRVMLVWLLLICGFSVPYYVRKLRIIRQLREVNGSVREHTRRVVRGIRALMRIYYLLCLWALPLTLGIGLFFTASKIMADWPATKIWLGLSVLVVSYLLIGGLTYFAMRWFARWWLQRLYGQHIDQLKASLAELEEPAMN